MQERKTKGDCIRLTESRMLIEIQHVHSICCLGLDSLRVYWAQLLKNTCLLLCDNANMATSEVQTKKLPHWLPFVSDEASAVLWRFLLRPELQNDVVLVKIPSDNIIEQLVLDSLYDRQCITDNCVVRPYEKIGDCSKTGVIYQVGCLSCNTVQSGWTESVASVHMRTTGSKRRFIMVSALGKHRYDGHIGEDFNVWSCAILPYKTEISARKTRRNTDFNV